MKRVIFYDFRCDIRYKGKGKGITKSLRGSYRRAKYEESEAKSEATDKLPTTV